MREEILLAAIVAAVLSAIVLGFGAPAGAEELLARVGNLDVPAGTIVRGDAVALGGRLDVRGIVEGNAVAVGGGVFVAGRVEGSVRAIGGDVVLAPTAVVGGAAAASGGRVNIAPGASVGGARLPGPGVPPGPPGGNVPAVPVLPGPPPAPSGPFPWWLWPPATLGVLAALRVLLWLVVLVMLAAFVAATWLTAALFPGVSANLAGVLQRSPALTFGVGLLCWAALVPLIVGLALSIVGVALVAAMPVALFVALQFGVTAIAVLLGRRLRPSAGGIGVEALAGAIVLAIAFAIPHLGELAGFVAGTWGLGTVLLAIVERGRARPAPPFGPPPPSSEPPQPPPSSPPGPQVAPPFPSASPAGPGPRPAPSFPPAIPPASGSPSAARFSPADPPEPGSAPRHL